MPDFIVDRRDVDFVLFDQFKVGELASLEPYKDFGAEDYAAILDTAIKMFNDVLWPTSAKVDAEGCKLVDGQVKVPEALREPWKQYTEGGWLALGRPPEVGGMGLPLPLVVMITELGIAASSSFFFFPGLTAAAGHLLEVFANQELKDLVVPKMYSGEWTGTMCLTEPQAGSSVGDLTTSATPIEGSDNEYLIKGNKIFISCGDHDLADNIIHLVLARVPGDPDGTKGISLFAVPKFRFDSTGKLGERNDVSVVGIEEKMGIHGSPTCALSFGDNDDCRGYLIGKRSQGIVYMFQMMNEARIVTGIQGAAGANLSYQLALAYAKERVQGTKPGSKESVRIIEHPDVRRNLMLAKSWAEGLRALLLQASVYASYAEHHPDEAVRTKNQDLLDLMTPICKAYSTDMGFKVTELAIQVHGGYGYIGEYAVEQVMRDVKIASLYEGTNGIQALDLLGRKMRMKDGALFMTWLMDVNAFVEAHKNHPRLAALVEQVDKGKNTLGDVAMSLGALGKEDINVALQGATPFLEMFGHVEVARLLTHQALIADEKLQALLSETGASLEDLVKSNEEARFLDAKIKTAQFFAANTLPHAVALAKSIKAGDRSALDVVL